MIAHLGKRCFNFVKEFSPNNIIMEDELNVLPCLQELKKVNIGAFGEQEQRVGYWDETKAKTIILSNLLSYRYRYGFGFGYTTSDMFDSMWNRDNLGKELVDDKLINKNGLLNIPYMTKLGFEKECGKMTTSEIWTMYMKFLNSKFDKSDESHSALLVSHHNRMKQLIPLKDKCNAYANNFTLHIEIINKSDESVSKNQSKYTIKFNIAFKGFPDKNEFNSSCQTSTCENTTETDNNEPIKIGQSEGEYDYCCNKNTTNISDIINTEVIENALKEGLDGTNLKKIDIFIVRHGNALHNKPMGKHVLDTSLTPLGIFQAQKLGEILKCEYKGIINANTVLCCSFLQRTQLTALCIYKKIMGKSFERFSKLSKGYNYLNKIAIKRYIKYAKKDGISIDIFYDYSPLNKDNYKAEENFSTINTILDNVSKGGKKKTRKARVSHKTTYKRKGKKSNSHRRRRRRNTKKRIR